MVYIDFKATGSNLRRTDLNKIVAFTKNELSARFTLNSDWDNLTPIVAVFSKDGGVAYDMTLNDNRECTVPWEVLDGKGLLTVSLVGGSTLTSTEVNINILSTGQLGGLTSQPSDTLYQQLLEKYNEVETDWESCKTLLDIYKSEVSASTSAIDNTRENAVNELIKIKDSADSLLAECKDNLAEASDIYSNINNIYDEIKTYVANIRQIPKIGQELNKINGFVLTSWEGGSINTGTGVDAVQPARIRTNNYLPNNITVSFEDGVKCLAVYYDDAHSVVAASTFVSTDNYAKNGYYTFYNTNASYIRLVAGYTNDKTIETTEIQDISTKISANTNSCVLNDIAENLDKALSFGDIIPFYFFGGIKLGGNLDTRDGSEISQKNRARTNLVTVPYNCTITSTEYSVRVFYYNADGSFKTYNGINKFYMGDNVRLVFIPRDGNEITDLTTIYNDVKISASTNSCVWYALGDSITQGYYSYIDGDGTETGSSIKVTSDCWANKVAEINNYKLINYGVGGSGFVHNGTVLDKLNAKAHVDTIDFSNADLVTIAFGVNDWKYNMALGSMEDDVATVESLYANMRYVIEKILGDNPLCKIVVITPINCSKWGNENTNYGLGVKFSNNGTLEDIFNAEVEICKYYGVEYIDMTHSSFINRKNITNVLPDGVHPSLEAHAVMGKELAKKIQF